MKAPTNENWIHKIKVNVQNLLFALVILIPIIMFSMVGFNFEEPEYKIIFHIVNSLLLIMFTVCFVKFLSFRLFIGESGFYYRSNPFNGRYYLYKDIESCKIDSRSSGGDVRKPASRSFYFVFTVRGENKREFQFTPVSHRDIINTLADKIKQHNQNPSF